MIDMSEIVSDPDFAQAFTVQRQSAGTFANEGEFTTSSTTLSRFGTIQPSKSEDLVKFLPEGERQGNFITIHCAEDVLMGNGSDQQSDIVIWRGDYYKVAFSKPWDMHGFWFAIAQGYVHG